MQAQGETMYVDGFLLRDKCGNIVTLHGVNYPVMDDWEFPNTSEVSAQIEQSGANAVRIQWYMDYGQPSRPAYSLADLDTVISRVARLDMIPILELHDYTCAAGFSQLNNNMVPWYTQNAMLALINKHKAYLIINLANEFGHVSWAGNPATAETDFKNAYVAALVSMRGAGIKVPLMIDAPDCGQSADRLMNVASAIHSGDPDHNVLFSVHAYWYGYAQNDSATMRNAIQQMANSNYCFVLGEVGNYQDDGSYCTYSLNYTAILRSAKDLKMGWLIWSWYKDGCNARQMTVAGNYANLTPFGNSVINHPYFGLRNVAQRSPYLVNGACEPAGIEEWTTKNITVYPNPAKDYIQISGLQETNKPISLVDVTGRILYTTIYVGPNAGIPLPDHIPSGCYILLVDGRVFSRIVINK